MDCGAARRVGRVEGAIGRVVVVVAAVVTGAAIMSKSAHS